MNGTIAIGMLIFTLLISMFINLSKKKKKSNQYLNYYIGVGYRKLSEFVAAFEITCMTSDTYPKVHANISDSIYTTQLGMNYKKMGLKNWN